jgi:PAS domain S-box-containing protein
MHDREIEQVIATGRPIRGDVPFTGTHGRRIYDYIFVPVFGANGEVEAIAGTTRDVTERKLAEERIRESEERLRFMAESVPEKIFTAKPSGETDYFNQQWMTYTGLTFENLREWNWTELVHPEDAAESLRLWRHSVESGEPFQFTHRIRRADGAYRWHLSRAHAMRAIDGKVTMWIGSSTEIQEQKDTEESLRRANEDLEQFAYAATHDLQEPLRSVKIYSDLLARRYGPRLDGEGREFLKYLHGGAARMERLVRDLLAYTHVGQLETPVELTDAGDCLRVAVANLAGAIDESGARISSDPLPAVKVHHTHLQQVFQNLIGNAIKYRRPDTDPAVHVTARWGKGHWHFTVADNGIGIEPHHHERIFGLFKRLHTNDKYSGTGVGLALCQRIVERNGGRIWVASEPGNGSQFHFTLPAQDGPG